MDLWDHLLPLLPFELVFQHQTEEQPMMQRAEELPEAHEPELGGCLASAVWGGGTHHQARERRETWGPELTKYDES